jgi:NtrC-family two-component system sensor histidine kinase KinB
VLREGNDATTVFWDIDAWPVKTENGTVVGIGMNTMEVTARLKIQQHREDLVATLVHDLKTPLVGADRAIQLLMQGVMGNVEPGQSEVLNLLRQSNQRLLSMVQNMIEVYRYELDKPKLFCEQLSVIALMRDSLAELNSIAQSKSVSLKSDFPERLGTVSADRMALRRVFQNLLDNAMKFTPSGGCIVASATETDDTVTVCVADNGIGIPESDRPMIFQRFSQGKSGKAYATGTGLGLYLCRQIVEAHHGQILFSTNEGEGTTFSVILPKQQPLPEQQPV